MKDKNNVQTLKNPLVLVANFDINDIGLVIKTLDNLVKYNQPIQLVCKHIEAKPQSQIIYNYKQGKLDISVITMGPASGDHGGDLLVDMSHQFNARCFEYFETKDLENIKYEDLGKLEKAEIKSNECFLQASTNKTKEHEDRIRNRLEELTYEFDLAPGNRKMILEERITRLQGKIALFRIGGETKIEQQEVKDKLIDALNSVKNTMHNGFLPGGGSALLHASKIQDFLKFEDMDEQAGITLLQEVCREPCKWICDNKGLNGSFIAYKLLQSDDPWHGYDVNKQEFGNMYEMGVIESYSNLKSILYDTISTGGMLLTTESLVSNIKNYQPPAQSSFPKQDF